jgi:hypothetical protein
MRRQTRQQEAFTIFLVDCRRIKRSLRAEVDDWYDAFVLKKALLKSRQLGLLLGMSSGQCLSLFPS